MRNIFHIFISVLMWCLFGYYWYVVGRRQINNASIQAVAVLGLITIVGLIITLWWIAHNKKLASRNRRSAAPVTTPETFDTDSLGRPIQSPGLSVLKAANIIHINLGDEGQKIYQTPDEMGA